ncbi:MAG: transketolase [Parcubacteria group bacterium Greene0714_21]|nr:MAG: transketolase [Parcubacteria group bacterium Greene0416_39]TSC97477.1 MAG: transketolase [Parcubacteria group bacterium Greene1014_47]TSD04432.1 MAG: transketolase [Parcubacteria group bacterium Greene0714_21]
MNYYFAKHYLNETKVEWKPMRDGAGIGMAELGETKKDMVVLGADTTESSRAHYFAQKFPERFIQVGVAEQNMIGIAAGLSYQGKVPYAVTYAAFLIGRPWEPIRTTIAYPERHVVFVSSHAGLATGPDGPTHQMTEDIAITRCLPGFTVIAPCDFEQARKAVKAAYSLKGPVYIRNCREKTPVFTTDKTPFEVGKAQILREGKDVTVIGHGYMVYWLLQIAEELKKKISIEVINLHTIKPLDGKTILQSTKKTKRVFCAEDHNVIGGMGSAVAEFLSETYPVPMKLHGVYDTFAESGSVKDLWKKYGLDKEGTKKVLLEFLKKV